VCFLTRGVLPATRHRWQPLASYQSCVPVPDHLGETAVWVDENSPEPLAERIIEVLNNEPRRRQLGNQLLKRAETFLQWGVIADQTLKIYEDTIHKKTGQPLVESDAVTARAV
jgi:glycosyltransferase involved in cell wall biosynthesis